MFSFRNPTADLLVVLLIVLLIWGPKRLPSLGKQLGAGIREFKDSITGNSKDEEQPERPEISQSSAGSPPPMPAATAMPERESAEVGSPERRS